MVDKPQKPKPRDYEAEKRWAEHIFETMFGKKFEVTIIRDEEETKVDRDGT